ncbi:MAG TPA: hypothetical protein VKN99_06955 [Polyangia bacterium]|nr:hypothetical protein [Polyangia bacterium]
MLRERWTALFLVLGTWLTGLLIAINVFGLEIAIARAFASLFFRRPGTHGTMALASRGPLS